MKNKELFPLLPALNKCLKYEGVKFAYVIAKNIQNISAEIKKIQEACNKSEKIKEYEIKRIELCKKYSVKDEAGEYKKENGNFVIDNRLEFNKELSKLQGLLSENDKFLNEDIKIDLHKIKREDLPEKLNADIFLKIMPLIEE